MAENVSDDGAKERSRGAVLARTPVSAPTLVPGWRCLPGAVIRAYGEEGPVDLAALHPAHGVAVIAFLDEGEEASPEEAREALRVMLRDEGFAQLFPGELPIVALAVSPADRAQLAGIIERAFAGMSSPTLASGWLDWLGERLSLAAPAPKIAAPRLLAPRRDEPAPPKLASALPLTAVAEPALTATAPRLVAPRRDDVPGKIADGIILAAPTAAAVAPERQPRADAPTADTKRPQPAAGPVSARWLDWGATLGFALGMAAALIAGLTAVLRNGQLF